ncbi:hypothetical protein [Luteimonas saliphila]|uniref:hypothetical protein n=1 Tax=Luteimonas saliphila TaxID=2804919 RepID=UPI00192D6344|nr:hypothetical protein [Luteimonas saliphila]
MSVTARLSSWWAAWKVVAMLAAALAGSLYLNYWQHRRAITAPLRDQVHALDTALEDSAALHAATRESATRLAAAAAAAADQLEGGARDYRRARTERPLTHPQCAPGQARMDAVNRALGAPIEGEQ